MNSRGFNSSYQVSGWPHAWNRSAAVTGLDMKRLETLKLRDEGYYLVANLASADAYHFPSRRGIVLKHIAKTLTSFMGGR